MRPGASAPDLLLPPWLTIRTVGAMHERVQVPPATSRTAFRIKLASSMLGLSIAMLAGASPDAAEREVADATARVNAARQVRQGERGQLRGTVGHNDAFRADRESRHKLFR